jgi:alcohol dehydrogenase class IV
MAFEFATAARIVFGPGRVSELDSVASGFGGSALWVTGATPERHGQIASRLKRAGVRLTPFQIPDEPTIHDVERGVVAARDGNCRWVVACGGGSVIDAGKAIAALVANQRPILDYLEIVGRGQPLTEAPLPFVAIPTTAGTGAEVTRNAVLGVPEHRVKVSLRSPRMLPTLALVDPDLTLGLPRALTASTGLDALTQLIEPFVSIRASPMTDALCREGIRMAAIALPAVLADGTDRKAREAMSLASLFGGLALANAGLGAVHGFAGPLGGMYPAPHGAVCAALLAPVCELNWQHLRNGPNPQGIARRYDEVAQLLTGHSSATAEEGFAWIRALVATAAIPNLSHWGVRREHLDDLIPKATAAGSMKGNPVVLPAEALRALVESVLEPSIGR